MALIPHEIIYRSDLASLGAFNAQLFADAMTAGTITAVYVKAGSVTGFSGDWYIGLRVDGTDVLTGSNRVQITAADLEGEKTGLSIPINFRNRMVPTVDQRGSGTINGPISVIVVVNDGITTDVALAITDAAEKTAPVNADLLGIVDSEASNILKKLSLASLVNFLTAQFVKLTGSQTIAGAKTFSSAVVVPDAAYDATAWNGDNSVPTKNAVRDKIEALILGGGSGDMISTNNLSDVANVAAARTNLGLQIGANVQAWDADLDNWAAKAAPTGAAVGTTDTQTLTNKRVKPRVQSVVDAATVTPDADACDGVVITAQATALTLANPTGAPTEMQPILIRIKDDGTARTIAYGTAYRAVGVTLPTTTVVGKTLYLGCIYNSTDSKFDVIGYSIQA